MNEAEKDNQEKLQPQLRFKGFTNPWEQRQLGKLAAITMGQSPSSKNYTANPADHILVQGNADIENGWVSPRRWTTEVTKTASPGDLIMSVRAPVGAMAKTAYDVVLGRGVAGIKGDEFLYQLLCSLDSSGYWSRVSSGSTFDAISGQELSHTPVTIPSSEEEQESIGQFFKTLDSTFNAAKRKYDLLKRQKQAYLQQMFPQKGERQPKLRFRGFTDPWEQRQLGKLAAITMGQSPSSKNYTVNPADHILVQGNADIEDGWVSPRRWTTEVTKTASHGDLIMSVRAPVGAMAKTAYDVVLGRGVAGIKGDEFLYQLLCSLDSSGYWSRVSSGSTFDAISGQELSHTPVTIPSSEEERKYIGQFFQALDSTLNAAKNKVEALQRLKQGYMQQMFV